jgi:hypothetical protein
LPLVFHVKTLIFKLLDMCFRVLQLGSPPFKIVPPVDVDLWDSQGHNVVKVRVEACKLSFDLALGPGPGGVQGVVCTSLVLEPFPVCSFVVSDGRLRAGALANLEHGW